MSLDLSQQSGTQEARDDFTLPFAVEALDARGRIARLGGALNNILDQHKYPEQVARAVGEAIILCVLLGSALKIEGRFQLQTKTDGPLNMIVVDFDAPDRLRAFARFNPDNLASVEGSAALLGKGHLALTIEDLAAESRYQGVVSLDGQGLEQAAHQYFQQSEQIPTFVRLAVAQDLKPDGAVWRGGGLLLQFLPKSANRQRRADLPPGDPPPGAIMPEYREDDTWTEARALAGTLEDHELVDPQLASEQLLYRLFHERGVRIFASQGLRDACRCSNERIENMLRSFSPQERSEMVGSDGKISVTCEFCSVRREFEPMVFGQ